MLIYALMDFQIVLQTGENDQYKDFDIFIREKLKLSSKLCDSFVPVKYIYEDDIGYVFKNADVYVGRAGANYVYEMGIYRKPSLLIPIPWVTNNEQVKNAQVLVDCGIGRILPQGELTAEKLHQEIKKFLGDLNSGKIVANESEITKNFKTDALNTIITNIENRNNLVFGK
jgi:UDP-N-acetylglucosamine--N-acetylmuramyl-(pentapeptide) pyrophosphoryl-undecaprenol N-acetylglucosamine transferase